MAVGARVEVLVVEDNPADVHRVREALDAKGHGRFHPTFAGGLGDARLRLPDADLILLDLSLPDSSGAETVARVREVVPSTPVVVLSGERDEATAFRCLQHGAQDVLLKGSVDADSLVRALSCALERQALARERDDALEQAPRVEQEVLAATRRLASGIARGLAEPLAAVLQGAFELSDGADASAYGPALQIQRAGWQASALARLLAVCAGEAKAIPEPIDLNEFVEEHWEGILECRSGTLFVEQDLEPGLPSVRADRRLLEQALLALARHARDAMPGGGTATVRTRRMGPGIGRDGARTRPVVVLEVSDTGPGLGPLDCRRIFEPYFSTEVLGIGTGLGLAPVLGIARQSGGTAEAESIPGHGTTVRMLLPPIEEPGPTRVEIAPGVRIIPVAPNGPAPGPDPMPRGYFASSVGLRRTDVRHYMTLGCEFID
jgi:signal transduction histidine kinase